MPTLHRITVGAPRWDLMLGLFEGKKLQFTLAGNRVLEVSIQALSNNNFGEPVLIDSWRNYNRLGYDPQVAGNKWLIAADVLSGKQGLAFMEYSERTRTGICLYLPSEEYNNLPEGQSTYIPDFWIRLMDDPTNGVAVL